MLPKSLFCRSHLLAEFFGSFYHRLGNLLTGYDVLDRHDSSKTQCLPLPNPPLKGRELCTLPFREGPGIGLRWPTTGFIWRFSFANHRLRLSVYVSTTYNYLLFCVFPHIFLYSTNQIIHPSGQTVRPEFWAARHKSRS